MFELVDESGGGPGPLPRGRDGGVLLSEQVDVAGSGMRLIRLGPDGRLDPAFGSQGSVELPFPAGSVALDGSGRRLVLVARDESDNRAVPRVRLRRCR